jgi:amino-acid N-acetyltransferase
MVELLIRKANDKDHLYVLELLASENLPVEDLSATLDNFFISEADGKIVGCIGMEVYGKNALLRSMAVKKEYRNNNIASSLVDRLFQQASVLGIRSMFLITTTAEEYFKKKGFFPIERTKVPKAVLQSKEFNGLCPSSAVIMRKESHH